jgi:hypothetical protein
MAANGLMGALFPLLFLRHLLFCCARVLSVAVNDYSLHSQEIARQQQEQLQQAQSFLQQAMSEVATTQNVDEQGSL